MHFASRNTTNRLSTPANSFNRSPVQPNFRAAGGLAGYRHLRPQRSPHAWSHGEGGPPELVWVVAGVGDGRAWGDVDRLHAPTAGQRGHLEGAQEEWAYQAVPHGVNDEGVGTPALMFHALVLGNSRRLERWKEEH